MFNLLKIGRHSRAATLPGLSQICCQVSRPEPCCPTLLLTCTGRCLHSVTLLWKSRVKYAVIFRIMHCLMSALFTIYSMESVISRCVMSFKMMFLWKGLRCDMFRTSEDCRRASNEFYVFGT